MSGSLKSRYEEETYFAMYEPKVDTSFVQEEHDSFEKGLSKFEDYLMSCLPPKHGYGLDKCTPEAQEAAAFDGIKLQGLIDLFAQPLSEHVSTPDGLATICIYLPNVAAHP